MISDERPTVEAPTAASLSGEESGLESPGIDVDVDALGTFAADDDGANDGATFDDLPPDDAPSDDVTPDAPPPSEQEVIRVEEAIEAIPAIARVAAGMWLRAAAWGVGTSLRMSARLARAAVDPAAAGELYGDIAGGLRAYAREFLGISDLDSRVKQLTPLAGSAMRELGERPEEALRHQGEELLRQAADVGFEEGAHPAYARILSELAPDEARILRLLAIDGPQAMVDIRAANLIGLGSQLIAPGMNMIGPAAGVRRRDRMPAYLNNLVRLGLVFMSDDAVPDNMAYQVLEAQPEVLSTIKDTARAKSIHRSIALSPFGTDFCEVCLPLDTPALPRGAEPPQLTSGDGGRDGDGL